MNELTHARLQEVLHYNRETGILTWIKSLRMNTAGKVAGSLRPTDGYWSIHLDGKRYMAHRLAWFYVHGEWPKQFIDHINGVRVDNRITNLRDVDRNTNCQNVVRPMVDNKSGVLGVTRSAGRTKYRAEISVDGKAKHLGCFDTTEQAHSAYVSAKRIYHAGNTL